MYTLNSCMVPECPHLSLSSFDSDGNLLEIPGHCFEHTKDKDKFLAQLHDYVVSHEKIVGLNAYGISFDDIDLTNKKFYGCDFQHCTFTGVHSNGMRMRMCLFS